MFLKNRSLFLRPEFFSFYEISLLFGLLLFKQLFRQWITSDNASWNQYFLIPSFVLHITAINVKIYSTSRYSIIKLLGDRMRSYSAHIDVMLYVIDCPSKLHFRSHAIRAQNHQRIWAEVWREIEIGRNNFSIRSIFFLSLVIYRVSYRF